MALTSAEYFAVSNHLTDWPHTMSYDEVCDGIMYGHEDVLVCEQFENDLPADVVESIEGMRITFLRSVAEMTEDLFKAIEDGDQQAIADRMLSLRAELGA